MNMETKIEDLILNDSKAYKQTHINIVNKRYDKNILINGIDIDLNDNIDNNKRIFKDDSVIKLKDISLDGIVKNDISPPIIDYTENYNKFLDKELVQENILSYVNIKNLTLDDFSLIAEVGYQIEIYKTYGSSDYYINFIKFGQPNLKYVDYSRYSIHRGMILPFNLKNGEVNKTTFQPHVKGINRAYTLKTIKRMFFKDLVVNSALKGSYFDYIEFYKNVEYRLSNVIIGFELSHNNELIMVKKIHNNFFALNMRGMKASDLTVLDNKDYTPEIVLDQNDTYNATLNKINKFKNRLLKNKKSNIIANKTPQQVTTSTIRNENYNDIFKDFIDMNMNGAYHTGVRYGYDYHAAVIINDITKNSAVSTYYISIIHYIHYNTIKYLFYISF